MRPMSTIKTNKSSRFTASSQSRGHATADENPPPVHTHRGKRILIALVGLISAAMLLLVVLNLDRQPNEAGRVPAPLDISALIAPGQLTPEDELAAVTTANVAQQIGAERGWIQTADGKEYRFESLEPLPNGWSKMTNPQIQAVLSDDRLLTMQAESALVRMP